MLFHVNAVTVYSPRANKLSLSFINVQGIPADFSFSLFAPKSVQVTEGQDCEIPYFIAANIWGGQYHYIVKDLVKAAKKAVHKRAEKAPAAEAAIFALEEAKKLNVEEVPEEHGEFFGTPGDQTVLALTIEKALWSKDGAYTGIWRHERGFDGSYYWKHPTYCRTAFRALDEQGHVFVFSTTNDSLASSLYKAIEDKKPILLHATIDGHTTFRGERQTNLSVKAQKVEYVNE